MRWKKYKIIININWECSILLIHSRGVYFAIEKRLVRIDLQDQLYLRINPDKKYNFIGKKKNRISSVIRGNYRKIIRNVSCTFVCMQSVLIQNKSWLHAKHISGCFVNSFLIKISKQPPFVDSWYLLKLARKLVRNFLRCPPCWFRPYHSQTEYNFVLSVAVFFFKLFTVG